MLDNDKDKIKAKRKARKFNPEAYKHAIGMVESSGGKHLSNPNSSASGKYHFLYNSIKNDPLMDGVTKREFMNREDLQESVMDKALNGQLEGYTYGSKYAERLKNDYDTEYDTNDITALVHFLGPGNTRKFLKDPNFRAPGKVNASPAEYVNRFREYFDEKYQPETPSFSQPYKDLNVNNTPERPVMGQKEVMPNRVQESTMTGSNKNLANMIVSKPASSNEFYKGGEMSLKGDSTDLVTMFEGGGTHEENPLGGIPLGVGANGKQNLVEEGETKWNDYIFSNAYDLDGNYKEEKKSSHNQYYEGGPIDPVKGIKKKSTEQPSGMSGPFGKKMFNQNVPGVTQYENFSEIDEFKPTEQKAYPQTKYKKYPYSNNLDYQKTGKPFELLDETAKHTDSNGALNLAGMVKDSSGQAFLDRYDNDWSRERLEEQSNMTQKDIDNSLISGLSAKKEIGGHNHDAKGEYKYDTHTVHLEKEDKNVETHERVHASLFDNSQGEYLQGILGNAFHQGEDYFPGEGKNMGSRNSQYMNIPSETYGNFAEFREKLGLKPGQQLTKEQYLKLVKEKGAENENFFRTYNDDNIIKALNTVAYQGADNQDNYTLS